MAGWTTTLRTDLTCNNCGYHGPMLATGRTIACPACGTRTRQPRLRPLRTYAAAAAQQLTMHQAIEAQVAAQFPNGRPSRTPHERRQS